MTSRLEAAKHLIYRCLRLRNEGKPEAVLRSELSSRLRQMFPDKNDELWVNHYTEGTEAATRIARRDGGLSNRFVDNLVRSTVIEYEPDLRIAYRWRQGYQQVREYAAGIIHSGTQVSQVIGILSDTIDWHVFEVKLSGGTIAASCTPEDIQLTEIETLKLEEADNTTAQRLIEFIRKYLAREQSRPLTSEFITGDLGFESAAYSRHILALGRLVEEGRQTDSSISLATELWSQFVDYLEGTSGVFRISAYVDEAYIAILARLLCANILQKQACLSNDNELSDILTGQYYIDNFHLHNMVEQDYFGWMLRLEYLPHILPIAQEIQLDLYAYDFSIIREEDLFGHLMTHLARRTQRRLLGQEWTPQWISKLLAEKCIELICPTETPCIVDMCCGSGSMLSEILKATRMARPNITFSELSTAAMGFDIDPLAVMLAKTTWVITLANEIRESAERVIIPVYHADSLFAITPITRELPMPGEICEIIVDLDGRRLSLPSELISPDFRNIFDQIVDWCYDEARSAQEIGDAKSVTENRSKQFLDALISQHQLNVSEDLYQRISQSIYLLAYNMCELAASNRNGIWAFILRNTYRPGLLAGQFNGLVSNPPWLAMSQFADNPYKDQLSARARAYGIKPSGAAHLHLELATTHLLHAVDRYLKPGAGVACLLPGTILNGQHHAKLRDSAYLDADRPVPLELQEIWGINPGTFKVRASAFIGIKRRTPEEVNREAPSGALASPEGVHRLPFNVRHLGSRTAWVLGESESRINTEVDFIPPQGADLMPRSAVCVEILDRRGTEWKVKTPQRSDFGYFAIKDGKKLKGLSFNGSVAPAFIHRMVQSLNLLPFTLDGNFVNIAIPALRNNSGQWEILDEASIRTLGFSQTARRFQRINQAMSNENVVKPLYEKIDERNKLSPCGTNIYSSSESYLHYTIKQLILQ